MQWERPREVFVRFNPRCTWKQYTHLNILRKTNKVQDRRKKENISLCEICMRALEIGAIGCIFHLLCTLCIFNDKWLGREPAWGLLEGSASPRWVYGDPGASASSSCLRHSHPAGADRRSAPPECQTLRSGLWLKELTTPTLTGAAGEVCVSMCACSCVQLIKCVMMNCPANQVQDQGERHTHWCLNPVAI